MDIHECIMDDWWMKSIIFFEEFSITGKNFWHASLIDSHDQWMSSCINILGSVDIHDLSKSVHIGAVVSATDPWSWMVCHKLPWMVNLRWLFIHNSEFFPSPVTNLYSNWISKRIIKIFPMVVSHTRRILIVTGWMLNLQAVLQKKMGSFLLTPHPHPEVNSSLIGQNPKFTRAWIKTLRPSLFHIPIMMCVFVGGGGRRSLLTENIQNV